jgi:1,4-dihydroxy-2-naphthoate octaprenyltransferase
MGRAPSGAGSNSKKGVRHERMLVALVVLVLLLLIFGGGGLLGSGLTILWWILIIGLILWVLGFFFRGSSGGRWYRW